MLFLVYPGRHSFHQMSELLQLAVATGVLQFSSFLSAFVVSHGTAFVVSHGTAFFPGVGGYIDSSLKMLHRLLFLNKARIPVRLEDLRLVLTAIRAHKVRLRVITARLGSSCQ